MAWGLIWLVVKRYVLPLFICITRLTRLLLIYLFVPKKRNKSYNNRQIIVIAMVQLVGL